MIERPAIEIAAITGGRLVAGEGSRRARCVSIDSRTLEPGAAFFAIVGPRHDGHAFLTQAEERGATVLVVSADAGAPSSAAVIRVDDTTRALAALAARERRERGWRLIAVTGSAGKTTTRELAAAALAGRWRTGSTPGNLNNQWGVPLSLLGLPDDTQAAVIELGMNHAGEIAELARIADPDVGVITNVGRAHLGHFESVEAIARAKLELLSEMRPGTTAVVPHGDRLLEGPARRSGLEVRTFGLDVAATVAGRRGGGGLLDGQRLESLGAQARLRLWGRHAALNALAALAAVTALGVDPETALARMSAIEPLPGRGRVLELAGGPLLVDESYNSNPTALLAVLEEIAGLDGPQRRVAVIGDMLELGARARECHVEAGAAVARAGFDALLAVGDHADSLAGAARAAGLGEVETAADSTAAIPLAIHLVGRGDLVLVKGSRGVKLERVADALASHDWRAN